MAFFHDNETYLSDGSSTLQSVINRLETVEQNILSAHEKVMNDFERASEHWKDKNADATRTALEENKALIERELSQLKNLSSGVRRLMNIIKDYEY